MSTKEHITGEFEPHVAYVRPGSTEQPFDDSESITDTDKEPLGYATPDAFDETVTKYADPRDDLIPYPVYIVKLHEENPDVVRRVGFSTFTLLDTTPLRIVSQYNREREVTIRNTSETDIPVYITEAEYPSAPLSFLLRQGNDVTLRTTYPIYAWTTDDGAMVSVVQEHDVEV